MTSQTPPTSNPQTGEPTGFLSYLIPGLLVLGLIAGLLAIQSRAETAAVSAAAWLPVGYAFGAGMVASVNPCGFLLLPSYISYHLGTEEAGYYQRSLLERTLHALLLGITATVGFVAVFAAVGLVLAAGGQWIAAAFPYGGVAIGLAMVALGAWLLVSHRTLGIDAATRMGVPPGKNLRNVFLFGVGYAVGSLGCTLPIFLVVVGSALSSRGFFNSLGQFVSYSLGMGTILIAVTVSAALFRGSVAKVLRKALPHVHRLSAFFLVGAGFYLLYYWVILGRFFF